MVLALGFLFAIFISELYFYNLSPWSLCSKDFSIIIIIIIIINYIRNT